jgi:hypothetical protein
VRERGTMPFSKQLLQWTGSIAVVGLWSCAAVQVGSDYDPSAAFAAYHTFTVMQREHRGTDNPLVAQRAEDAIKEDLQSRGYRYVSDSAGADFAVDFTIGSKERTDITSYPYPDVYMGGWWRPGAWWGAPYWGDSVDVTHYREGTLSIDIFDNHSHRPVWHGWAKKELTRSDVEHSEAPVRQAVAEVLARFPPNGTPPRTG